ncbi:MAG: hypothetical protein DLM66_14100 [Candidatus Dormiibacter spiritus]|nr:MAG: hypothetical protein DLM66_14100 [Candidatus Dormibacteraeota bacterium]
MPFRFMAGRAESDLIEGRRGIHSGTSPPVQSGSARQWDLLHADALRALFENAVDGLVVLSAGGDVIQFNRAARRLLGGSRLSLTERLRGIPLAAGSSQTVEAEPGGAACEVRAAPTSIGGEKVWLLSVHDVTALRRTEQERESGRQEALDASRIKGEILNLVAHEFRSPLSVIGGYLSMMAEGQLGEVPPMWALPIERTQQKVEELKAMVNDVLTAARLESGRLQVNRQLLDAGLLVKLAAERAKGRVALLEADLQYEVSDEALPVNVDSHQLGIVLDNLVNNALNYSDGKPELRLTTCRTGDEAEISVCDHGPGVAPELQETIFERFQRGGGQGEPRRRGIGLGLAIARDLAELNGGRLRLAWSELGRGSRFTLRLPLAG